MPEPEPGERRVAGVVSRRKLFAYTGAVGAGGAVGLAAGIGAVASNGDERPTSRQLTFYGAHQPGIAAPVQSQGFLTAFDLKPDTAIAQVRVLLRQWTDIAASTMSGRPLASGDDAMAYGRGPSGLSVTAGVGASLLTKLGLGHQIPAALTALPAFPNDALDPSAGDGDLCVLVAANDGLVAAHALRALQRAAAASVGR